MKSKNSKQTAASKKTVFETKWFSVEQQTFAKAKGLGSEPYYRIHCSDGVLVLATNRGRRNHLGEAVFGPPWTSTRSRSLAGMSIPPSRPAKPGGASSLKRPASAAKKMIPLGARPAQDGSLRQLGACVSGSRCRQRSPVRAQGRHRSDSGAPPAKVAKLIRTGKFQQWSALALLLLADCKRDFRIFCNR